MRRNSVQLMDVIRLNYLKSKNQLAEEAEEKKMEEEKQKQKDNDNQEVMRFWQSHDNKKISEQKNDKPFNIEKFIELTPHEKKYLL